MSIHAVELALHDLGTRKEARQSFARDGQAFLGSYRLTAEEAAMMAGFDVASMLRAGASPLLTYGFWMMNAPARTRASYLDKLQQPLNSSSS